MCSLLPIAARAFGTAVVLALVVATSSSSGRAQDLAVPSGFRALFNGRDPAGWRSRPLLLDPAERGLLSPEAWQKQQAAWDAQAARHWRIVEGAITGEANDLLLATAEECGDLEFLADVWSGPGVGGVIRLRGDVAVEIAGPIPEGRAPKPEAAAPDQIEPIDAGHASGATLAPLPRVLAGGARNRWTRLRIVQVGSRVWVWNDGRPVAAGRLLSGAGDLAPPLPGKDPVRLRALAGGMRLRNLFARDIPSVEANRWLAAQDAERFAPLFDGKTLQGWKGATDAYEVKDGAIRCRAGTGGVLFTEAEYDDFQVRLEFRLPPAGNNGLAIRFGGEGDPAFDGFCEVQILDDGHRNYRNIQPWQACGSAYGLGPARRGGLRPTGEWNACDVTVRGSTVRVELNGFLVFEGDLAATTPLDGRPHPGLSRRRGHFGFAGHEDPVEFRAVRIRRLAPDGG